MAEVLSDLLDRSFGAPNDTAITDGSEELSWDGYRDAVSRGARLLVERGVRRGDRVGIHLPKSVWSFVAVHSVLRAGAVMVPLDPLAPLSYGASVAEAAGVRALISDAREERAQAIAPDAVHIPRAQLVEERRPLQPVAVSPDDDAYIIFTSGTTGGPKGIVHSHRSALAYARLAVDTYGIGPGDRLANIASLHFDQSTFELYAAPLAGSSVIVVPDAVLRFPASVTELIEREKATVWYSVPHVLRLVAERGAVEQRDLSRLRWVLFGGESYASADLARLMRLLPGARFSNVYGPAEVNQCTYFHLDEPPDPDVDVPIGVPWAETAVRVVDSDRDVPDTGELWVSSVTMMDRYWNAAELTREAIVDVDGRRWYRTGDLVETNTDGDLVFLGRIDNQVKVRGQRIEPEMVERHLLAQPGVVDAAVVVDPDQPDVLAALVVADVDEVASTLELTRSLRSRLPAAAVPGEFCVLDASSGRLPTTPNGKLDRPAALATLVAARSTPAASVDSNGSPT